MPIRSMGQREIYGNPSRQTKALVDLTDINGIDLLDAFETWALRVPADHFTDKVKKTYGHQPTVTRFSRMVLIEMRTGHFGIPGEQVFNVTTYKDEYTTRDLDASTTRTRCAMLIPPGSQRGLFFTERQGQENCGTRILDSFLAHMSDQQLVVGETKSGADAHLVLHTPPVVKADAWLATADLEEIQVIQYAHEPDVAATSPLKGTEVTYTSIITPEKGQRSLPRRVWDGVRGSTSDEALAYLALTEVSVNDVDELIVKVGDGEQSKKYVVGKTRTPAISTLISDAGQPPLDTEHLVDEIDKAAKSYFEEEWKLGWDYAWTRK